jgi:hypothetical protein
MRTFSNLALSIFSYMIAGYLLGNRYRAICHRIGAGSRGSRLDVAAA